MAQIQEIDRALVVAFDIEGYSKKNTETQAKLVSSFVQVLDSSLKPLRDANPDAFSTGDGAIVSIGRNCKLDKRIVKLFMDFVIDSTLAMLGEGLVIKTAVNYSEKDSALILDDSTSIQGKLIQIGDTINEAVRIITFCEPREIMISESVQKFLGKMGLDETYSFFENEPLTTKHNKTLKTFTYDPNKDEGKYLYSPHCSSHDYKKFSYFPPVKTSMLDYFKQHGLDFELKNVISYTFESMRELNATMKFISWHSVLDVLTQLRYDPEDTVYVLSRNDRTAGFWTQPRMNQYLTYLRGHADQHGGYINQTRVMIYDDLERQNPIRGYEFDLDIELGKLHKTSTLFSLPSSCLLRYEKLNELIFGFTLSKRHKYAIIPIPAAEAFGIRPPKLDNIGETLRLYEHYDVKHGPLRAIVTARSKFIDELTKEMESLLRDDRILQWK